MNKVSQIVRFLEIYFPDTSYTRALSYKLKHTNNTYPIFACLANSPKHACLGANRWNIVMSPLFQIYLFVVPLCKCPLSLLKKMTGFFRWMAQEPRWWFARPSIIVSLSTLVYE